MLSDDLFVDWDDNVTRQCIREGELSYMPFLDAGRTDQQAKQIVHAPSSEYLAMGTIVCDRHSAGPLGHGVVVLRPPCSIRLDMRCIEPYLLV